MSFYACVSVPVQIRHDAANVMEVDPRSTLSGGGRTYLFWRMRERADYWAGLDADGTILVEIRCFDTLPEARAWAMYDATLWRS